MSAQEDRLFDELSAAEGTGRVEVVLAQRGEDQPLMRALGIRLNLADRPTPAVLLLRRAIQLSPDCPRSHGHLGMALLKEDRPAEGEHQLREAIGLEPDWSTPKFELGRLLGDRGEREEAELLLRSAHELDPDWHLPPYHLAMLLERRGAVDEVERLLREVTRLKPTWEGGWQQLIMTLHRQRRFGEAGEAFEELSRLRPHWRWAEHRFELLGYPRDLGAPTEQGADGLFLAGLHLYREGAMSDAAAVLAEAATRATDAPAGELAQLYSLLARQCTHPDLTLASLMPRLSHDRFFFVQIGAMDGRSFDPIYEQVRGNGWRGLLVEPIAEHFARLRQNYRDQTGLVFEQAAIGERTGSATIHGISEDVVANEKLPEFCRGMHSLQPERTQLVEYEEHVQGITVRQMTLAELLRRHRVERIDLLQIDVEGMDYEVLRQLDTSRFRPQLIHLEFVNLPRVQKIATMEWLRARQYLYKTTDQDLLAISMETMPQVFSRDPR